MVFYPLPQQFMALVFTIDALHLLSTPAGVSLAVIWYQAPTAATSLAYKVLIFLTNGTALFCFSFALLSVFVFCVLEKWSHFCSLSFFVQC